MGPFRTLARNYRLPGAADPEPLTVDHDAAEAEAMAAFYAAPDDPAAWRPGDPDPLAAGLGRGFHAHRTTNLKETSRNG
ncbi:hypothetical protein [Muricoccus radiodurans]|uniref:hypothetical protein n=1 Tax=Muricoccus radiodurans TaxID=2231721 RepID=UPI003CFA084E